MISLHKKGATDDSSNYKPISLLSMLSKISEKIMHKRLCNFLGVNHVLHTLQFGFRRKHSTQHTLLSMTEKSRKKTMIMETLAVVFSLHLKKAFDTVNYSILVKKSDTMVSEAYL